MYYANYFRFMAHAREAAVRGALGGAPAARLTTLALSGGRLASPAVLGDVLAVRSHIIAATADTLTWRHAVVAAAGAAGSKPHAVCDVVTAFACATTGALQPLPHDLLLGGNATFARASTGELLLGGSGAAAAAAPFVAPLQPYADNAPVAVTRVDPFPDEVGPSGAPSETDVLRWFERNRTDSLDGAAGLRALQAAGVLVVVTSVGDMRMDPALLAAHAGGGPLLVHSGVLLRRRGTFIIFRQELYGADGATLLAQAEVTCACVAAADMKLTPAPPELAARLAAAGARAV